MKIDPKTDYVGSGIDVIAIMIVWTFISELALAFLGQTFLGSIIKLIVLLGFAIGIIVSIYFFILGFILWIKQKYKGYNFNSYGEEETMQENNSSKIKHIVASIIVTFILTAAGSYLVVQDANSSSYDKGYDAGYETGYNEGMTEGYNKGFDARERYDIPKTPADEIPDTAVFATPHGEKYHRRDCRYVSNKTDIGYYETPDEAEADGLTPCSVCF